ncbi:XRE family transcriptional regulator [Pseudaquabacterium rugosum]|uniref:XRE family transcriptional regulator n=1 Tax=Pseudaquabacterium rugosum TaxID=2984194 RepID=A0ABU9BD99_9BURK
MPKLPQALAELPPAVAAGLRALGADLALARKRRKQSRRHWAQRIGISEPTLARLEQGDPGVAIGLYATALWLIGRSEPLAGLADPQLDLGALEADLRTARARSVRQPLSLAARLGQAAPAVPAAAQPQAVAVVALTVDEPRPAALPPARRARRSGP